MALRESGGLERSILTNWLHGNHSGQNRGAVCEGIRIGDVSWDGNGGINLEWGRTLYMGVRVSMRSISQKT